MKYLHFLIVGLIIIAGIYFGVLTPKKPSQSENIIPDNWEETGIDEATHLSHHSELNQE